MRSQPLLAADALYRKPQGAVTPRPPIPNEDTERAIAALGASVDRDAELPRDCARRGASRGAGAMERLANEVRGMSIDDAMVARFAAELLDTRFVSDATFAAALDALGERGLVNLMVLMGHSNIRCAQQALAGAACVL